MKFNHNRLKGERIAKNLTVQEMADYLEVSKGTYSKKENGKIPITVDEFAVIFDKLEISPDNINIFFTLDVSVLETNTAV